MQTNRYLNLMVVFMVVFLETLYSRLTELPFMSPLRRADARSLAMVEDFGFVICHHQEKNNR
jgi:hypothetical protein